MIHISIIQKKSAMSNRAIFYSKYVSFISFVARLKRCLICSSKILGVESGGRLSRLIYFTFVIFCRRTDSLLAKQILEEANGLLMYRNRYRLGAIFNEKSGELNIKQVSPKSHYKDIYRKMSGELRRFAGGDAEI